MCSVHKGRVRGVGEHVIGQGVDVTLCTHETV